MKGRTPKFNVEQVKEICLLYEAGAGSSTLATQFGTYPHKILRAVRASGGAVRDLDASKPHRARNNRKFNEEQAAQIRLLYEAGTGSSTLAEQAGVTPATILAAVRRAGGTIRDFYGSNARRGSDMKQCHTETALAKATATKHAKNPPRDAEHAALRARKSAYMRRIRGIKPSPTCGT